MIALDWIFRAEYKSVSNINLKHTMKNTMKHNMLIVMMNTDQ